MSCFGTYSCTKVQRSIKISGFTLKSSNPKPLGSFGHHMVKLYPVLPNIPCIHLTIQKFANDACKIQLFLDHFNEEL